MHEKRTGNASAFLFEDQCVNRDPTIPRYHHVLTLVVEVSLFFDMIAAFCNDERGVL